MHAYVNIPRCPYISHGYIGEREKAIFNSVDNIYLCNSPAAYFFGAEKWGRRWGFFKISSHKFRNDIIHRNYVMSRGSALTGEVFRIVIAKVVLSLALRFYRYFYPRLLLNAPPSSIIVQCFLT